MDAQLNSPQPEDRNDARLPKRATVIKGAVEAFNETGTEGALWAVYEDGKVSYDALALIEDGDHLTIRAKDGSELFSGIIDKVTFPPFTKSESITGQWIHWVQKGYEIDAWARLFLDPENRAELIKA